MLYFLSCITAFSSISRNQITLNIFFYYLHLDVTSFYIKCDLIIIHEPVQVLLLCLLVYMCQYTVFNELQFVQLKSTHLFHFHSNAEQQVFICWLKCKVDSYLLTGDLYELRQTTMGGFPDLNSLQRGCPHTRSSAVSQPQSCAVFLWWDGEREGEREKRR